MDTQKPELEQLVATEKPKFNPNAHYQWDASQVFEIDGKTFDVLFNFLQTLANSPDVQKALVTFDAFSRLQGIFAKNVEEGAITEVKPGQPEEEPQTTT